MNDALWISNALLWLAVVALAAVVVALVRQIGVLHERLRPVGALAIASGPGVGAAAPRAEAARSGRRGGGDRRARSRRPRPAPLLPLADLPGVQGAAARPRVARAGGGLRVVLASDGPREEHAAFVARERIALPYVLGTALGLAYRVGKLPWAALVDGAGVLRAQGLVNTREHLESLLEAKARGVASIQE